MENWLTFSPGESGQFFVYYPRRKALVGFPAAYGSEHFTDTHFHQGYFVYAAGLLSQLQPGFAGAYCDFARLIEIAPNAPEAAIARDHLKKLEGR